MRLARIASFVAFALVGVAPTARAQPAADATALERAKELFRQGNELRKAGDCSRALAMYRESRSLVPSVANTTNSAVCMAELGLDDEALEMYEELLVRFRSELTDDETKALASAMTTLRRRVGRIDVSSNVQSLVVIDGRPRGQLPLAAAIPVVPGTHVLRVIKDGYETFEQRVTVSASATVNVDAKLVPLVHAGRLRIDVDSEDAGAEVSVDGATVGTAPWEGSLTTGSHLVVVRKNGRGSRPIRAVVVENQTVAAHPDLAELGPELRIIPDPLSARLAIDGVAVGPGEWRGALPLGAHVIEAREDGYLPQQATLDVGATPIAPLVLRLDVDAANPRTARRSGSVWIEARTSLAIGAGLGSGAEASCDVASCSDRGPALGGLVGVRVGYRLPSRVSFHVGAGYLSLTATLSRRLASTFVSTGAGGASTNVPVTYDLHDSVGFAGPFAGAGIGYSAPLGSIFELLGRVDAGIVLASASDTIRGTVTAGGRTLDLAVEKSGASTQGSAAFAMPEIAVHARFGRFYGGVGAAAGIFVVQGPALDTGAIAPKGFDCAAHPGAADCVPASNAVRGERAFGPAFVALPTLEIGLVL